MAEETNKMASQKSVQKPYYVENVVRRVGSRLHRAKSATRHRFKLFIGPRRLLRNKKMAISEMEFEAHKDTIKKMVLDGRVALYLPDGMKITSLPDGRLVYRRADGAVKVDDKPQPVPDGKTVPAAPQKESLPAEPVEVAPVDASEPPNSPPEPSDEPELEPTPEKTGSKKKGRKRG